MVELIDGLMVEMTVCIVVGAVDCWGGGIAASVVVVVIVDLDTDEDAGACSVVKALLSEVELSSHTVVDQTSS